MRLIERIELCRDFRSGATPSASQRSHTKTAHGTRALTHSRHIGSHRLNATHMAVLDIDISLRICSHDARTCTRTTRDSARGRVGASLLVFGSHCDLGADGQSTLRASALRLCLGVSGIRCQWGQRARRVVAINGVGRHPPTPTCSPTCLPPHTHMHGTPTRRPG